MKWLYLLFRLFKCPHKWKMVSRKEASITEELMLLPPIKVGYIICIEAHCVRCGKIDLQFTKFKV